MKMGMAEIAEAVPVHPVTSSAYTEKAKNGSVFDFYVNKLLYRIFSDNSNFIPCILRFYILSIVLRQVFGKIFMPISVTLPRIVPLMFCNQRFPLDNR